MYPGIAIQAGLATFAVVVCMLTIYSVGILRPTPTFNKIVFTLAGSIMPRVLDQHLPRFPHAMVSSVPALLWADWHWN